MNFFTLKDKNNLKIQFCIILLSVGLIQLTGCSKFLDKQPLTVIPTDNYYNTEAQLNTALTGIYTTLASDNMYAYSLWGVFGVASDESFYRNSS